MRRRDAVGQHGCTGQHRRIGSRAGIESVSISFSDQ
jgi:hypothetical protein